MKHVSAVCVALMILLFGCIAPQVQPKPVDAGGNTNTNTNTNTVNSKSKGEAPRAVLEKYKELSLIYKDSLGATLKNALKRMKRSTAQAEAGVLAELFITMT